MLTAMATKAAAPSQASVAGRLLAARRRRIESTCEECGCAIQGTARRKFCSNTCSVRFRRRRTSTAEPIAETRCDVCGEPVLGTRSSRIYCSAACSQKAYRRRQTLRLVRPTPRSYMQPGLAQAFEQVELAMAAVHGRTSAPPGSARIALQEASKELQARIKDLNDRIKAARDMRAAAAARSHQLTWASRDAQSTSSQR
jgi:hypothetical protein